MTLPVIAALDGMSVDRALELIEKLAGKIWGFKVNDLYHHSDFYQVFQKCAELDVRLFIDLKLHDIPQTVENTVKKVLAEYPLADIITVHASGGEKMIAAAVKAAGEMNDTDDEPCAIAGVSVLTSLDENTCGEVYGECRNIRVGEFAVAAHEAGAKYVVCSAAELNEVKFPDGIKRIVPGIRTGQYAQADDQACVGSVYQALVDGADLLVIGRALTKADDPEAAVEEIAKEIEAARKAIAERELASAAHPAPSSPASVERDPREAVADQFIAAAIRAGAFLFGEFKLKSGRMSPYFFNSGMFNSGSLLRELTGMYAWAVKQQESPTVIAGPAYKGIPLAIGTAEHLDLKFMYDRKVVKSYGDGGDIVGYQPDEADDLVMVDDVITTGATKIEFLNTVRQYTSKVLQVIVAFDRQEKPDGSDRTAIQDFTELAGIPVRPIATLADLLRFLGKLRTDKVAPYGISFSDVFSDDTQAIEIVQQMAAYREKYCVK